MHCMYQSGLFIVLWVSGAFSSKYSPWSAFCRFVRQRREKVVKEWGLLLLCINSQSWVDYGRKVQSLTLCDRCYIVSSICNKRVQYILLWVLWHFESFHEWIATLGFNLLCGGLQLNIWEERFEDCFLTLYRRQKSVLGNLMKTSDNVCQHYQLVEVENNGFFMTGSNPFWNMI